MRSGGVLQQLDSHMRSLLLLAASPAVYRPRDHQQGGCKASGHGIPQFHAQSLPLHLCSLR